MALHESVLAEFGLSPLWVRRGMAAPQPVDEADVGQGAAALAGQHARRDEAGGAAAGATAAGAMPAGAASAGTASAGTAPAGAESGGLAQGAPRREMRAGALQAGEQRQADPAPTQSERGAPIREQGAAPSAGARERFDTRQQQPESRPQSQPQPQPQPQRPASQQSRAPEPSLVDTPPDDDFAWFDDLPAHAPADARRESAALPAINTLDWDALSERVAGCQLCRLCEKRTNTVFGVGDRGADWMLIGEAPGENEDRLGEPFVGQAGKLLDNMLRSLMLARDSNVYIANVIKCRPPGNRNPEPDEVARCEPYLQRQVSLVKPKLIVALGRFAAQSLLKTDASISSLRGRVHEYEGVPVIVTYHPAYLLRSLPDKAKAWADLCLARDTWRAAGGGESNAAQ
ncbi:Phage SPO1 DNA polymerase-related protein [Paraburkholderia ribeironis]|uniref:Type-4 uracil-DNA glycosylase n=1 Tax=Paraburkholderia ribeironis TaxID=1247936 RepID=A0A1N7RRB4_9BURK|nr:uracil-DNA glycosylase [Paraburkholderia ribeironis]SIT37667.1 Phage SPO1 DNA polymerase-related protein [Paraburkholderia ribeironis]